MALTEKYAASTLFSLLPISPNKRKAGTGIFKPFEETLVGRLRSLLPVPDCSRSITLSWISRAVDLLSLTLADAAAIFSDPSLASTDRAALSSHIDSSIALLDACNVISAAADQILRGRLHVCVALHHVTSSPSLSPDRRRRARSAIAEWEAVVSARPLLRGSTELVNRLRHKDPNRGRLTAVGRAIYAMEAVSDLVARSSLAALGEKGDILSGIRVSGDFPWAASYNEVAAAISSKLCRGERAGEIEEAEAGIRRLAAAIVEDGGEEDVAEELRNTSRAAEKAIEELTEGLDLLTDAVNRLFRASLATRDAALQCFRVGPGKCK